MKINQHNYDSVLAAARALRSTGVAASDNTWALADAVHAAAGSDQSALETLAAMLEADGETTMKGEPYTVARLRDLSNVAATFPPERRYPEAAVRTHEEVVRSEAGKHVLHALVCASRGEPVSAPDGIDPEAFKAAVMRVTMRVSKGFKVNANDIRIALGRKPNLPGRPLDPAAVAKLLDDDMEFRIEVTRNRAKWDADQSATDAHNAVSDFSGTDVADKSSASIVIADLSRISQIIRQTAHRITLVESPQERARISNHIARLQPRLDALRDLANGLDVTDIERLLAD